MKLIRAALKPLVLAYDRLTAPNRPDRSSESQEKLDEATRNHTLYQLLACPFCVKVRHQVERIGLNLAVKDVGVDPKAQAELMAGGKIDQVPCLRIDRPGGTEWLYESSAINQYLQTTFGSLPKT